MNSSSHAEPRVGPTKVRSGPAALLAAFAAAAPLAAQTAPADDHMAARPSVEAAPARGGIVLDGDLGEPSWQSAPVVRAFTQNDPREGQPASQPTEVRVLYDDEALYVGAVMRDEGGVSSRLGRRDAFLEDSDWFTVSIDSHHDHLTAYRFMVNPAGVRGDEVMTVQDRFRGDDSWDPVWEVETAVGDSGWTAEMRIPFSQLRFSGEESPVWGIQLERTIARLREEAVFSFTPKSERGGIPRYGHLRGLEEITQGGRLELLPYIVGRVEFVDAGDDPDAGFSNPYRDGSDFFGNAGLDLKYRLTSDLTIDGTVNPDFGQVEVDPAVVNLTAYETRFDEKRPFFVEGGNIFQFGGGGGGFGGGGGGTQLLYSRRIGSRPRGGVPDEAVYADRPDAATILAAAKLTGRTGGGWVVGLMDAVTQEEGAPYVTSGGSAGEEVVAPLSNYFVGRLQKNLRGGRTVVGGMATAVHRRLEELPLASELRSQAYAGGADFRHEWAEREWSLSGYLAGSWIRGSEEAIADAQLSSARYFDRPDADHLDFDPGRTSLRGYTGSLELNKDAGLHWRGRAEVAFTSPGFEVNDLGFQRSADRVELQGSVRYVENQPGDLFRDWWVNVSSDGSWNYGGDYLGTDLSVFARGELLGYWSGSLRARTSLPGWDDRLTRGGPLTREVASHGASLEVESDSRKPWTVSAEGSFSRDEYGGREYGANLELELRPSDAVSVSIGPEWSRARSVAQYVGSVEDPLATETFGGRYLFADLEETQLSIETRVNVTFRPGLTLEVFAQPFIASGAFGSIKELRAPRTFSFLRYGEDVGTIDRDGDEWIVDPDGGGPASTFRVDDEDFNERSLRGNAVLRWEWTAGSTLFLVWQQSRSDEAYLDDFDVGRDSRALFRAPPDNIFLIKVSYWFSP